MIDANLKKSIVEITNEDEGYIKMPGYKICFELIEAMYNVIKPLLKKRREAGLLPGESSDRHWLRECDKHIEH